MTELPSIENYSPSEIGGLDWPAVDRYLQIRKNLSAKPSLNPAERLRFDRHEAWLKSTLATALNRAEAKDICAYWSDASDELIRRAWKISGCDKAGFALLALGKLGSRELNLSSDVDLVVLRDEKAQADSKAIREFQKLLSENTEYGFCFRVDFTLRPGGASSPLVPTFSELENYYGYHGETWERLAYVRMRILEGTPELRAAIEKFAGRFAYRRHLDYTLIDELKSLRRKIRSEKFETRPNSFHLKLGIGGIREIELFTHVLQVIHGGRDPNLRTNSTTLAIERLESIGVLSLTEANVLKSTYWWYRDIENRIHGFEDQQTYLIDLATPPRFLESSLVKKLETSRSQVCAITDAFFGSDQVEGEIPIDEESQRKWLLTSGFSQDSVDNIWPEILSETALSRESARDEKARLIFLDGFVKRLAESGVDRDLGLALLLDFVRSTRAKATFFTLLNRVTKVRDELALLFSISPYLGSVLASRPELIDEFILRRLPTPSGEWDTLLEELAERRLLAELISATTFLDDRDLTKMSANLTLNADSICSILLARLKEDYGPSSLELIALGKWGGRELGLKSDLDYIFVVDGEPTPQDQKVAKRFLSRIIEPHRGGAIYNVDLRLRPNGSSGPILVSKQHLKSYLSGTSSSSSAAWERQAYLRSRALTQLDFSPAEVATRHGLNERDREDLRVIRSKLFTHERPDELDLKLTLGGLADIEFSAQIALLERREFSIDPSTSGMIQYLEGVDSAWTEAGPALRSNYEELRGLEQLYQLTTSQSGSKMRSKSDEFKRLALVMKITPRELEEKVRTTFASVRTLLGVTNAKSAKKGST